MERPSLDTFVGSKPSLDSFQGSAPQPQPTQQDDLLNNPVTRGIQNFFPGKQLGNAIGNSLSGFSQAIQQHSMQPIYQAGQENSQNYGKIAGDTANIAGTIAAPLVGGEGNIWAKIGTNAALGAGLAGANSISQGEGIGDVAKSTALGGAVGGGLSAAGEGASYLANNMPNWFTKLALPKMGSNVRGTPQETIDYALNNTKGLTLKSMYNNSKSALSSYEDAVQSVLKHPNYANETGNIGEALKTVQENHGNAGLDEKKIANIIRQVAPENKSLVDKIVNGTATLGEQNTLRKELDQATKAAYGDKPNLSFAKKVGKSMADFLRSNVQDTAKETAPIFSEYSKEHTLNKALTSALNKKRVAGPLVAGGAGFAHGGITGALEAIAVEEGLRSPTAKLLAAKGIKSASKVVAPIAKAAFQGGKAPLIKSLSNQDTNQ